MAPIPLTQKLCERLFYALGIIRQFPADQRLSHSKRCMGWQLPWISALSEFWNYRRVCDLWWHTCCGLELVLPNPIEKILWRTASIMSTALLPIMYFLFLLDYVLLRYRFKWRLFRYRKYLNIIIGGLYVIARLVLLVEIFRTLFYLPEDAYITTWASNIPHVS